VEALLADGCDPRSVMLVHNPATPGDPWVPEHPAGVDVCVMPFNTGYAGGMNEGLRRQLAAGADRVLLLTHDVRPEAGMVGALEEALSEDRRLGVAGPLLIDAADGEIWSAGAEGAHGMLRHRADGAVALPRDAAIASEAIDGTVMLLRGDAARQIGGFDERFFMYFEESELCLRAKRAGWKVAVVPAARAVTAPGKSKRHAAHAYFLARNGLEYARLAGGVRGLAAALVHVGRLSWWAIPKPWSKDGVARGAAGVGAQRLIGTGVGLLHFALRRWGAPPSVVLRTSDISGTEARTGQA
jgi:GT2 family glycosyltransferase